MTRDEFITLLHPCINAHGAHWHTDAARFLFVHTQTISYAIKHNPSTALASTLKRLYKIQDERKKLCEWTRTVQKRAPLETTVVHGHHPRFKVREKLECVTIKDLKGDTRFVHRRAGLEWYWLDSQPDDPLVLLDMQTEAIRIMDEGTDDLTVDQRIARYLTKKQRNDLIEGRHNESLVRLGLVRRDGSALTIRGDAIRAIVRQRT